jgi:hypothetical protein
VAQAPSAELLWGEVEDDETGGGQVVGGGERRRGGEGGEGGEKEARDPELLLMEWCKRPLKLTHAGAAATFMCALPPSRLGGAGTKDGNPLVGMRIGTRHEDGRLGD